MRRCASWLDLLRQQRAPAEIMRWYQARDRRLDRKPSPPPGATIPVRAAAGRSSSSVTGAEFAGEWAKVPAIIFVTQVIHPDPFVEREDYGAVCCAVQNLMLGAQAAGLASFWGTGDLAQARPLADLVGAGENERMVGLIRLGYAAPGVKAPVKRTGAEKFTRWVE
jgi:nitroreductase